MSRDEVPPCHVTRPCVRRQHHYVRRHAAVRVGVRPHRGHLLHLAHPHGAAHGGPHHPDLALANDGGRAAESVVLRGLARLPPRLHR